MSILIAIEGIDGSGGSTHCKLLTEWLKKELNSKEKIFLTREPSDLPIGNLMRVYLKKTCHPAVDALLFAADRADHYFTEIKPAIDAKKIVISDRNKLSSYVYQSSQGIDEKWIQRINNAVPDPDLNIILDIDPETSLKRKNLQFTSDNDKFETVEMLSKVREKYVYFASRYSNVVVISSKGTLEETQEEIRTVVKNFLKKKGFL
ncbi:MAG: dTMP kinase [Candidatus Thorarchaeota archaeon]